MSYKKIAIVGNSFFPEKSPRAIRTTELAKEFAKQGHQVTVFVPREEECHSKFENNFNIKIKDIGHGSYKDIDINSGGKISQLFKRALKRGLDLFLHYPTIGWMFKVKKALKKERGFDLLISIAVPHPIHWGVAAIWKKDKSLAKTWVADCGDPFMLHQNDTFKKIFYFRFFEKSWGRKTDYIAVPFTEAVNGYYPEFSNKIVVIPQGFTFPEVNFEAKTKNKVLTFIYSGDIGSYRHFYIPFFDFIKKLEIDFNFIIFTKERYFYENELSEISNKIEIRDYVERKELIETFIKADFLVHFPYQNNTQRSVKLVDYGYSKTPVLSYKGEKDNELVKQFLDEDYKNKLDVITIDEYRIENVCKQFLELCNGDRP